MNSPRPTRRPGFTLVELLVVIFIISILVALITVGVNVARVKAEQARITAEISSLDMALVQFKDRHGVFPLDFTRDPRPMMTTPIMPIMRGYLSRMFPRYAPAPPRSLQGDLAGFYVDLKNNPPPNTNPNIQPNQYIPGGIDPAEALVFWLGGFSLPAGVSSVKLQQFSANPQEPFQPLSESPQTLNGFFEFDQGRLKDYDGDGWWEYIPQGRAGSGQTPPYVYFNSASYSELTGDDFLVNNQGDGVKYSIANFPEWGVCVPYRQDPANVNGQPGNGWVNAKKFQLISAGLDGVYASVDPQSPPAQLGPQLNKYYPSGLGPPNSPGGGGYGPGDLDNLTNFSNKNLEDSQSEATP